MKVYVWVSIIVVAALCGCKDLGTVAGPEVAGPAVTPAGRFVVDEFTVDCEAKVNPRNDSLQACFPAKLRYHFEDSPGSLTTMIFTFDKHFRIAIAIDGWPDSVGQVQNYATSYWTTNQLAQQDSVIVECKLSGCYGTTIGGNPEVTGCWAWQAEQKVVVRR